MAFTTEEVLFYRRNSRLFSQNSYISKERSYVATKQMLIYKEQSENSRERCSVLKITVGKSCIDISGVSVLFSQLTLLGPLALQ